MTTRREPLPRPEIDTSNVDLSRLSEDGKATMRTIGMAIYAGFSQAEIASELGVSPIVVFKRLAALREELRELARDADE